MKRAACTYFILVLLFLKQFSVLGQTAVIPDANFLTFLKNNYPATINGSNQLIIAQAASLSGSISCSSQNISSIEGLQYFTGINSLDISTNQLTNISQVANLTLLKTLHAEENQLAILPSLNNLVNLQRLIVHTNQLKSLPELLQNIQLTQLVLFNNQLASLPDLSVLSNLKKIDAGNNLLTVTPNLSGNLKLTNLYLDRNYLTQSPDLANLDSLTSVQLHSNYFSFSDLIPYTTYPGFSSVFIIQPQKNFPMSGKEVLVNNPLTLSTNIDPSISGDSYQWYFNGASINTVTNDSLIINPVLYTSKGYYYCLLTNPSIPGLRLVTDSFFVDVIACPSNADFSFEYEKVSCMKNGTLKINLLSLPTQAYTFYLKSIITSKTDSSTTGFFKGLTQPEYILSVTSGTSCQVTLSSHILIPYEECIETFITPDNDKDRDSYYFEKKGTAIIYDKTGAKIKSLIIPNEWDGSSNSGKLVTPGYYVVDINNGEETIRISVIY